MNTFLITILFVALFIDIITRFGPGVYRSWLRRVTRVHCTIIDDLGKRVMDLEDQIGVQRNSAVVLTECVAVIGEAVGIIKGHQGLASDECLSEICKRLEELQGKIILAQETDDVVEDEEEEPTA